MFLLDDQAARYGSFDDVIVVGLIENDWPEAGVRNIFYPPALLKALGWPSEKDRHAAAEARFLDLSPPPLASTALSTFTLEDEAIVTRSALLDEVGRARLSTIVEEPAARVPVFDADALLERAAGSRPLSPETARVGRSSSQPSFGRSS